MFKFLPTLASNNSKQKQESNILVRDVINGDSQGKITSYKVSLISPLCL